MYKRGRSASTSAGSGVFSRPTKRRGTKARAPFRPGNRAALMPAMLRSNVQEIKSVDFPVAASSPKLTQLSTTATFDLLNGIQEGASFYNRIGRKVMMRSVHVKGQIVLSGKAGSSSDDYIRIMLVYDRQPNGAAPVIADLLTDYDNAGATSTSCYSALNMNNAERFVMLRDHRIQIPIDNGASVVGAEPTIINYDTQANINDFVRLQNMEAHFKSSTNPAAIGDISTGALWLVTVGFVAVASNSYALRYTARLRYHDV